MLPDAFVDALVVAAEDNEVPFEGKFVGNALGEDFPVRGHVDDLIVGALGLQFPDTVVNGLYHHHHAGVPAVGVVVHGLARPQAVAAKVVYLNLHQAFFDGPPGNGMAQGAFQQLRNNADDVYS